MAALDVLNMLPWFPRGLQVHVLQLRAQSLTVLLFDGLLGVLHAHLFITHQVHGSFPSTACMSLFMPAPSVRSRLIRIIIRAN